MFVERKLEGEIKDFAQRYLGDSLQNGRYISNKAFSLVNLKKGNIYTYLPIQKKINEIKNFNYGMLMNSVPALEWAGQKIQQYFALKKCQLGMIEDYNLHPKDPVFIRFNRIALVNDHVYHSLTKKESADLKLIEDKIAEAESVSILNALFGEDREQKVTKKLATGANVAVTEEWVEGFVSTVKLIVVMAFDGEGYLVWERAS